MYEQLSEAEDEIPEVAKCSTSTLEKTSKPMPGTSTCSSLVSSPTSSWSSNPNSKQLKSFKQSTVDIFQSCIRKNEGKKNFNNQKHVMLHSLLSSIKLCFSLHCF